METRPSLSSCQRCKFVEPRKKCFRTNWFLMITLILVGLLISPTWGQVTNLAIQNIEVTQATQCLDQTKGYTKMPDNSLELSRWQFPPENPLGGGPSQKPVIVRVYLTHDGPPPAQGADPFAPLVSEKVPVKLRWFAFHDWPPPTFLPNETGPVQFQVPSTKDLDQLRNDERGSVNFILPSETLGDPNKKNWLWIEAEIDYSDTNSADNIKDIWVGKDDQGNDVLGGLVPRLQMHPIFWVPIVYKPLPPKDPSRGPYTGPQYLQDMNKPFEDSKYMKAIYPIPLFFAKFDTYIYWVNRPDLRDDLPSGGEVGQLLYDEIMKAYNTYIFLRELDATLVAYLPDEAYPSCRGIGGTDTGTGGPAWVVGSCGQNVSIGAKDSAIILAHEVAHTLDIWHINDPTREPCWPFPGDESIKETGFSILTNKPVRSDNYSGYNLDFMRDSGGVWVSPYTWNRLLKKKPSAEWSMCSKSSSVLFNPLRLASTGILRRPFQLLSRLMSKVAPEIVWASSGTQPVPALLVSGRIFSDGTGKLSPLYQFEGPNKFPSSNPNGKFCVDLRASDGTLLATHGFDLTINQAFNASSPTAGGFSFMMPFPSQASWALLRRGEVVLNEIKASQNKPQISLSVSPSEDPASISWTASDLDGDKVYLAIMYSPDAGSTFAPMAVDLETNSTGSLEIFSNLLRGSNNAILRIMATDGFNTTSADSSPFQVSNKPPAVVIHAPQDNSVIDFSRDIIFSGLAYDPEDGNLNDTKFLNGTNLVWKSNLNGVLGSGETLVLKGESLSQGNHEITLTAKDSSGHEVSASVLIKVASSMRIDIKPDSYPNSINPSSKGVIPVAIIGSNEFDVTSVDAESLRFGPNGASPGQYAFADVNGDGLLDLVSHYKTQDCGFGKGIATASLTGNLKSGTPLLGTDSVRIVH